MIVVVGAFVVAAVYIYMTTKSAGASEIIDALKSGAKVIDVRTVAEFKAGHYPGAINIPVNQVSSRLKKLGDPAKPVVMYCHSGMRSASAKKIAAGSGFENVINAGSYHHIMQITSNK
jgi:phage shock protein E